MQFANNKFIATLVITNIIAFTIIFVLIWLLWNNNATITNKNSLPAAVTLEDETGSLSTNENAQKKSALKENMATLVKAIVREVKKNNLKLNKLVETDSSHPQIAQNNANQSNKILSDKEYLNAYNKLITTKKPTISYTEKDLSSIKILNKKYNAFEKNNNHFNKVDVSQLKRNSGENTTLAQQISSIIAGEKTKEDSAKKHNPAWKDYLETLQDEGAKRKNEMRTIKVKQGETLWKISIRAYGTGFKYKKIFKANPHLTSPHSITTGEILRVPL